MNGRIRFGLTVGLLTGLAAAGCGEEEPLVVRDFRKPLGVLTTSAPAALKAAKPFTPLDESKVLEDRVKELRRVEGVHRQVGNLLRQAHRLLRPVDVNGVLGGLHGADLLAEFMTLYGRLADAQAALREPYSLALNELDPVEGRAAGLGRTAEDVQEGIRKADDAMNLQVDEALLLYVEDLLLYARAELAKGDKEAAAGHAKHAREFLERHQLETLEQAATLVEQAGKLAAQ